MIRVTKPVKFYMGGQACYSSLSVKECATKLVIQSDSCKQYDDKMKTAFSTVFGSPTRSQCFLDADVVLPELDIVNKAAIKCDSTSAISNFQLSAESGGPAPVRSSIVLGADFLGSDSKGSAAVLAHELVHKQNYQYHKENVCLPSSEGAAKSAEQEVSDIANCCINGDRKACADKDKLIEKIRTLTEAVNSILMPFNDTLGKDGRLSLNISGLTLNEKIYVLSQFRSNFDKYREVVLQGNPRSLESLNDLIFGKSCAKETIHFGAAWSMGSQSTTGNSVTSDSNSSGPLDTTLLLRPNNLNQNADVIQTQVAQMIPSTTSATQMVNDVYSSAQGLFNPSVPGDYPVSQAVADRVSLVAPSQSVASASKGNSSSKSVWSWNVLKANAASGLLAGAPAQAANSVASAPSAKTASGRAPTSVAKSGGIGAETGSSSGGNTAGAAMSKSAAIGGSGSKSRNVASTSAADSADPVGLVNQIVGQGKSSSDIVRRLKSRETVLVQNKVSVIFSNQTFGSKAPAHILVWKNGQFIERR